MHTHFRHTLLFVCRKNCLPSIGKIDLIPTSGELEQFQSDNVGMQGN